MSEIATTGLTADEARQLTAEIKGAAERIYSLLLRANEGRAWSALGYGSWRDYAMAEFGMSQSYAYRLLDQARVVRDIEAASVSPIGELPNESQARELAKLPEADRADVWAEAVERTGGKPTAKVVSDVAKERAEPTTAERAEEQSAPERFRWTCFGCKHEFEGFTGESTCPKCGGFGTNCKVVAPEPAADPTLVPWPDRLTPEIARLLEQAGADGLTVAQLVSRSEMPDALHAEVQASLIRLSDANRVLSIEEWADGSPKRWALTELVAAPEDLPAPPPGEGRSAGLPSAADTADESAGSVVDGVAADKLPAAACEACGGEIDEGEAGIGYQRCDGCDSAGDHVARELDEGGWGTCRACHPDPEDETELVAGQDYRTDPAERIAAVAEVAPQFVQPVEPDSERAAAMVAAALDQFVPDPFAGTIAWRKDLHERLTPVRRLTLWLQVDDAAEFASADDVETLRQLALEFTDLHRRVVAARQSNVVPLRAVR